MSENTVTACDKIETGLLKIRHALETLEQPLNFESLTVRELKQLKAHKESAFLLAKRIDEVLKTIFNQEK